MVNQPGESPRAWTREALLSTRTLADARISPDGDLVAFVVRAGWREGTRLPRSRVWLAEAVGRQARPFTAGPRADLAPRWSPDGRVLAFLSDREEDGCLSIFALPRDGGEARRLVGTRGNVSEVQWSPDGRQIAFLVTDPDPDTERAPGGRPVEFERQPRYQRLWVADADGTASRCLTAGDLQVWEFSWFADGRRLAAVCSDLPFEWSWYRSFLAVIEEASGALTRLHQGPHQLARPLPRPDGREVLFIGGIWSDRGLVGGDLYSVPSGGGEAVRQAGAPLTSFTWAEWLSPRALLLVGYQEGEAALFTSVDGGRLVRQWRGVAQFAERWWARASVTADGSVAALIREDPASPPDVWTVALPPGDLIGEPGRPRWTPLTELQAELRQYWQGDPRTLRWQAPDGTPGQGILLQPLGYRPGERIPLLTLVHGGPSTLYHHGFVSSYFWWVPLLLSQGCAVLLPNPRGSTGWGSAFAEANLGDLGGGDLTDVLAGVEAAIAGGAADPERQAIAGWSYGGFMTAWAVTQTRQFRAAVVGAGISNWRSFHGVSNIPSWDRRFLAADPYEIGGRYDRFSPVLQARVVRTPTLIVHGQDDACVPVGQAYELFRALRDAGVETELVVYPGEGHAIQERAHVLDLAGRGVDWVRTHLHLPS